MLINYKYWFLGNAVFRLDLFVPTLAFQSLSWCPVHGGMSPSSPRHLCFCFFSCCGPALLGLFSETLPLVSVAAPSAFPPVCPLSVRVPWELPSPLLRILLHPLRAGSLLSAGPLLRCHPHTTLDEGASDSHCSPLSCSPVSSTASCMSHRQIR